MHRITYPLTAIQKGQTVDTRPTVDEAIDDEKPEKSVECLVLTHPKHITADVIFIHGLHGSLEKTWRQGDWRHDNHQLKKTTIERRMSTGDIDSDRQRNISLKRSCSDIYSCAPNKVSKTQTGGFDREVDFEENMETCGEEARQQQYSKCWPKDWLPLDCPGVRAISLNYTTDPYLWRPVWIKKRNR